MGKTSPVIDYEKCKVSKKCIEVCPMEVFRIEDGKVFVKKPEECIGCKECEVNCPTGAIKVKEE